jgi:DNA-directed RNA polymerase specialized sigma24 family protein
MLRFGSVVAGAIGLFAGGFFGSVWLELRTRERGQENGKPTIEVATEASEQQQQQPESAVSELQSLEELLALYDRTTPLQSSIIVMRYIDALSGDRAKQFYFEMRPSTVESQNLRQCLLCR